MRSPVMTVLVKEARVVIAVQHCEPLSGYFVFKDLAACSERICGFHFSANSAAAALHNIAEHYISEGSLTLSPVSNQTPVQWTPSHSLSSCSSHASRPRLCTILPW